jgi:hypothetical protein
MTRRAILLAAMATRLRADAAGEVWDLFSALASSLASGDASEALSLFDPAMPSHAQLRDYLTALLRDRTVESSITPVKNEGGDSERSVVLDWIVTIVDSENTAASTRREQRVSCKLAKTGRKWRITAFEPLALLAPPDIRPPA